MREILHPGARHYRSELGNPDLRVDIMATPVLTISSKNYSSWALRGWLLCKMSGLKFEERKSSVDDASMRAELLLLSPSCLVPCLEHMGIKIWDTFAIAEYLREIKPKAGLYPAARGARAHCRAVSGEMHSGFFNLRSALPMNLKARHPGFKVWAGAQPDIARITEIWRTCLGSYGGPYLFGAAPTVADAMYAPVCTRFRTYDVPLDAACAAYRDSILAWPILQEWIRDAESEPDDVAELDVEF
jgi:glutathione S-transferase